MRATSIILLAATLCVSTNRLAAQEKAATSRIVAVGLFKNGLAVVKRELAVPGPGTYRLEKVPQPVHGTWWLESTGKVESSVEMRDEEVPASYRAEPNFQEDLAGMKVVVHFKGGKAAPVNGTVLKLELPKGETERATGRFLLLKTERGRLYVDTTEIGAVEVAGDLGKIKQRKPVLLLKVTDKKAQTVYISYLTHGLGWAPSYRVDISDPKVLTLEQATVIKNELEDLDQADTRLISGYPSIQFANVRSPLAANVSWASFFNQLRTPENVHMPLQSQVLQNTMNMSFEGAFPVDLSATPMGEGVDLHFQAIGKRSLTKGEALSLSLAKDKAAYERIIEWVIADNRDEHGRYVRRETHGTDDDPWDALRFKNPFAFPMTTGPAMVTANGQFNGQRLSHYVNAGEETVLRITKALSIRTRNVEQEDLDKNASREILYVGGRTYRKAFVAGELTVSNHRKEDIKILIRRRFSGDLLTADGEPRVRLREEGVYSINKRNELTWALSLKGGQERRLNYRYTLLVVH